MNNIAVLQRLVNENLKGFSVFFKSDLFLFHNYFLFVFSSKYAALAYLKIFFYAICILDFS